MTHELTSNNSDIEKTPTGTEAQFMELWEKGEKVEALEVVMGRYINASEISAHPDFLTVIMQPTASKAYAAALSVKTLEELAVEAATEKPWDTQKRLVAELKYLQASGASEADITAKATEINNNVARLVESGEVDDHDAWALSVGFNPSLEDQDQHGDF